MDIFINIGLYHYLILGLVLFCIALFGIIVSRNLVKFLICSILLFNSAGLNFAAFSVYNDSEKLLGTYFQLFILILTLLELILGSYLIYCIFKYGKSADEEKINTIRG